jgi:hypothetical protein
MSALHFTLVGAGEVVSKYWLHSESLGKIVIDHIISLERKEDFNANFPNHSGRYHVTTGNEETVEIIKNLGPSQNIALLIPEEKLGLAKALLDLSPKYFFTIFWEKPYITDPSHITGIQELLRAYSDRIHLSGKYGSGRSDILYTHLPEGEIPEKVEATLIEGTSYFKKVVSKIQPGNTAHFVQLGPELDFGFHILDIVSTACKTRFSPVRNFRFTENDVSDLSRTNNNFLPKMGFSAQITVELENGRTFPLSLTAGKAEGPTDRKIHFVYPEFSVFQEFTTPTGEDPVLKTGSGQTIELERHSPDYDYYSSELSPLKFAHQLLPDQLNRVFLNQICLQLRSSRHMSSNQ